MSKTKRLWNWHVSLGNLNRETNKSVFLCYSFDLKKQDKMFLLDLKVQVCFESDNCMIDLPVMTGTEVPQLICDLDAKVNLKSEHCYSTKHCKSGKLCAMKLLWVANNSHNCVFKVLRNHIDKITKHQSYMCYFLWVGSGVIKG